MISSSLRINEEEIFPLYLNRLETDELRSLSQIISNESLYFEDLKNTDVITADDIFEYFKRNSDNKFADILLKFYKSTDIHERILKVWNDNRNENISVRQLAIISVMKAVMQIDLDFTEMIFIMKIDYSLLMAHSSVLINEFFDINGNDVKIRSSIIAHDILYNIIGIKELTMTMTELVTRAGELANTNRKYKELIKNLVSHSHFYKFKNHEGSDDIIKGFYNDIRNVNFCKDNPFFWVQFASVCIDLYDFSTAKTCLDNAYNMSKCIPKFVPYQIDTTSARLNIEEIIVLANSASKLTSKQVINIIVETTKLLTNNISHEDNNVNKVFKISSKYKDIFELYKDEFDLRQQSIFTQNKVVILKLMTQFKDKIGFNPKWKNDLESCEF
jgi:hypothetical protein